MRDSSFVPEPKMAIKLGREEGEEIIDVILETNKDTNDNWSK